MYSNFPFQLLLPILRLLTLLAVINLIWLIFFNSLIVLWARLISLQNRQMALLRFVCVPCIVYLNAIVSNFNLSHMDVTELLWRWPRVSHFPKLLHLSKCIRKEYRCANHCHCQKHFVIKMPFLLQYLMCRTGMFFLCASC